MKEFTHKFTLSDEAYELLLRIKNEGRAEYKDTQYESLDDFRRDNNKQYWQTEDWFLNRNTGGTYYLIPELYKYNLVTSCDMSWHTTFELTKVGIEIIEQNS